MGDFIIIAIIGLLVVIGVISGRKHFKNGGCCGGESTVKSKKKLNKVIGTRTVKIEGMTCENCANRVEWAINDIDGLVGKVNLKKHQAVVSMEKDVDNAVIKAAIEKAGYDVIEII